MCEGASLLVLPVEILERIVTHSSLSLRDICRLSLTCRRLHSLIHLSWAIIAHIQWDWLAGYGGKTNDEWYGLIKERYLCELNLDQLFHNTIKKGVRLYLTDEDEMDKYEQLITSNNICSFSTMECVLKLILQEPLIKANLSYQYYGLTVYEYLKRQQLRKDWVHLLSQPTKTQLLIHGAVLISQWIDPLNELTQSFVMSQITDIAHMVGRRMLNECSNEDDETILERIGKLRKDNSIKRDNVLQNINIVMYDVLRFKPAEEDDYYQLENSLIDKVLEKRSGIPITLSAVYQAIAYQLGVVTLPVNFPTHFLLKAPQNEESGDSEMYIDAYNNGRFLTQDQCLDLIAPLINIIPNPDIFNPVEPYQAIMRMVANIYSRSHQFLGLSINIARQWSEPNQRWGPLALPSALCLQLTLCNLSKTNDFTRRVAVDAAGLAIDLRFNVTQVINVLTEMLVDRSSIDLLKKIQQAQNSLERTKRKLMEPTRVKKRDLNIVWFTIGKIMKHKRYNYRCVIYGWDTKCEMNETWIVQMGVNHLPLGPNQPFYNVLVEDGTNRYAAQENLFDCPRQELGPIHHWEVGKYFQTFTGSEYLANHALLEKYPPITEND